MSKVYSTYGNKFFYEVYPGQEEKVFLADDEVDKLVQECDVYAIAGSDSFSIYVKDDGKWTFVGEANASIGEYATLAAEVERITGKVNLKIAVT